MAGLFTERARLTETRGSQFACQPRVPPRSDPSLQNKRRSSTRRNPFNCHAQRRAFDGGCGHACLTPRRCRCQLQLPEGPPGPLPAGGAKASQSLPALQAPAPSRCSPRPLRRRRRGLLRRACARGPAGVHCRAFLKRATAFDHPIGTRCHLCSRHPLSTRSTHRAAVFAFLGSPHDLAHNSTPPWTFGQGWTHASGWRYESRTDPPVASQA